MSALVRAKSRRVVTLKLVEFTLASGTKAWKGARAVLRQSDSKVVPATATTGAQSIGVFTDTVDATAADKTATVDLEREVTCEVFANGSGGDAIAATDVGRVAYMLDDQTVSILPLGKVVAGRIWRVGSDGVAIEKIETAQIVGATPAVGAFAANDLAPTASSLEHGAVYDVPATGAASTVTLPAAAPDGIEVAFAADGTKNGHTVQYRDATGPANLTTALTASKRHLVICKKRDGAWFANAYVSP